MADGNFVKIDRKILSWGWYTDVNTCKLFIHCLLKANWKPGFFHGVACERGQFITSLSSLSRETGLSIKAVRTALSHLNKTNEVASRSTSKFTVITVKNYDKYQSVGTANGMQMANEGHSKGTVRATIEERKNNKKGEERKNTNHHDNCDWDFSRDDEKLKNFIKTYGG